MIDQGMGGDIVYISSKNCVFAGPEQRRLRRGQGRPGAPGAAARRRARRARHPRQRGQPRRGRPRLRHLRRRLGRAAGRGLRRRGGGARARTTRSAPCSSARCCPSTSPTRVFALTGGDLSHTTGPAHPRRRRRRRRVPAMTRPPAQLHRSPPSTSARPAAGWSSAAFDRPRRRAARGAPLPQRARCAPAGRLHWDVLRSVQRGTRRAARRRRRFGGARRQSGSTAGGSTTACSTPTGGCSATRSTTASPGRTSSLAAVPADVGARRAVRRDRHPAPAVQHACSSSLARAVERAAGTGPPSRAAGARPVGVLAVRRARHRADQRLHDAAARSADRGRGPRGAGRTARAARRACSRRCTARGACSGRCCRTCAVRRGGRTAVRWSPYRRTTPPPSVAGVPADGRRLRVRLHRHLGARRCRAAGAGDHRRRAGRRTSPTRSAWTARSGSCAT